MLKYITNIIFLLAFTTGFAQKLTNSSTTQKDTTTYKTAYGLRLGLDISKPALSIFDKSYSGLEIVGDYRISDSWYIATELGYEEEITFEDFSQSTSKGSYIRLGVNYNAYENWLDMNNEIYVGMRYGFALFDQTLNNYTPNVNNTYFPSATVITPDTDTGLMAHWAEFQLGIKAETFKNLFLGFSFSYKVGLSIDDQENFKTLYAPGFNRVFESATGFGFNYTISYLIPIVNK
ncbi:Porin family protein [Tenacibaculum sp. 190130A14a]|uniref:Porin family protein n=1 Tax=Tenacibaculum polynesiense TaxID=3137857 RepID=A0ABP1EVW6_9FLAO